VDTNVTAVPEDGRRFALTGPSSDDLHDTTIVHSSADAVTGLAGAWRHDSNPGVRTPSAGYVNQRLDQIEAACAARDGKRAVAVIDLIHADGYPDLAREILTGLVGKGLDNLAAGTSQSSVDTASETGNAAGAAHDADVDGM
jgi:hypothetical protein